MRNKKNRSNSSKMRTFEEVRAFWLFLTKLIVCYKSKTCFKVEVRIGFWVRVDVRLGSGGYLGR